MSYDDFLDALGERESGGDYGIVATLGYLGKYQFGELALVDIGYYELDGTAAIDWKGNWTGKDGIDSKAEFLASGAVQEQAIRAYMELQWAYLGATERFAGQTIGGIAITESSLLAGAHLLGAGTVTTFLEGGAVSPPSDPYGTPIVEYMTLFAGFDTPFTANHAGGEAITGGPKADILRGFGGDDRLKGLAGKDILDGGSGGDRLAGGKGGDVFRFSDLPEADTPDRIKDFRPGRDKIALDADVFPTLAKGPLDAAMFRLGKEARDGDDHILYHRKSGTLLYDADGDGEGNALVIAIVADARRISPDDIVVG